MTSHESISMTSTDSSCKQQVSYLWWPHFFQCWERLKDPLEWLNRSYLLLAKIPPQMIRNIILHSKRKSDAHKKTSEMMLFFFFSSLQFLSTGIKLPTTELIKHLNTYQFMGVQHFVLPGPHWAERNCLGLCVKYII